MPVHRVGVRDVFGESGPAMTIDPVDARDFDDAVGASRLAEGGYELWVHIADVTHYVGWDTPIDDEAKRRTCSVYLVDRVLPMARRDVDREIQRALKDRSR